MQHAHVLAMMMKFPLHRSLSFGEHELVPIYPHPVELPELFDKASFGPCDFQEPDHQSESERSDRQVHI